MIINDSLHHHCINLKEDVRSPLIRRNDAVLSLLESGANYR